MNTKQDNHITKPKGIIGSLIELFRRPFPVMEDLEMRWIIIVFHGVFIAFFLLLFKPFQSILTPGSTLVNAGFGLVVSAVLAINHFLVSSVLPLDLKNWTIGKSVILTHYEILSVILGVFIYKNYWTNFENFTWTEFFNIGSVTLTLAIIPVTMSTIFLENWLLRRNLRNANRMQQSVNNAAAANATTTVTNTQKEETILTLYSENKSEWIKIRPSDLIYLENTDNYVSIFYREKEEVQKKLLRSTLTKIEEQIKTSYIQRCHRSYLINLHQIQYVDGNSRGLQLQLLDMDKTIPVSRKYVKTILNQIEATK